MKLPRLNSSRKWILIGVGALVVAVGLYVWWSAASWQAYGTTWHETRDEVKREVAVATKGKPSNEKEYAAKRSALRKVATMLSTHKNMCNANVFVSWQQFLHAIEASVKECKEVSAKHAELQKVLSGIVSYLDDEQKLQKELVLLVTAKVETLDEKNWATYSTAATDVQKKVSALKLGREYSPVTSAAKKQLATITTTWKSFNEAHDKQDRAAWEKAKGELVQAYATIPAIADVSEQELQKLLKRLDTQQSSL